MAYSDKIRNKAYELYLTGFTYEQIVKELKMKYRKECKTLNATCVFRWSKRYSWDKKNVKEMATYAIEKKAVDNVVDMNAKHGELLELQQTIGASKLQHIRENQIKKEKENKNLSFEELKEFKITCETVNMAIEKERKMLGLDNNDDEDKAMEKLKAIFDEVKH